MFCSKCGAELTNERICPNCGERVSEETGTGDFTGHIVKRMKCVYSSKKMYFSLIALMILEWILVTEPVVEVGSSLVKITRSFTFFELQDNDLLKLAIIALHLVSIIVLVAPLAMKRECKGRYFAPAAVTSLIVSFMCIRLLLRLDSLITDTSIGEILQFVAVDISLTATSTCLIIVSIVAFAISAYMVLRKGVPKPKEDRTGEVREKTFRKMEPLFEKGQLKVAAIVLAGLCLVVSAGLLIPTAIRNLLPNAIVGSWYVAGAEKGSSPYLIFHSDNTCEVHGLYGTNQWNVVDGNLKITTFLGETQTYHYEWEGNNLIIDGVTFTRSPSG